MAADLNPMQVFILARPYGEDTADSRIPHRKELARLFRSVSNALERKRRIAKSYEIKQSYRVSSIEDRSNRENLFSEGSDGKSSTPEGYGDYISEERETSFYHAIVKRSKEAFEKDNYEGILTERDLSFAALALRLLTERDETAKDALSAGERGKAARVFNENLSYAREAYRAIEQREDSMPYYLGFKLMTATGQLDSLLQMEGLPTIGLEDVMLAKSLKPNESIYSDSVLLSAASATGDPYSAIVSDRRASSQKAADLMHRTLEAIAKKAPSKEEREETLLSDAADETLREIERIADGLSLGEILKNSDEDPAAALYSAALFSEAKESYSLLYANGKDQLGNIVKSSSVADRIGDNKSIKYLLEDMQAYIRETALRLNLAGSMPENADKGKSESLSLNSAYKAVESMEKLRESIRETANDMVGSDLESRAKNDIALSLWNIADGRKSDPEETIRELRDTIDGLAAAYESKMRALSAMRGAEWAITMNGNDALKTAYSDSFLIDPDGGKAWEEAKAKFEKGERLPSTEFYGDLFSGINDMLAFRRAAIMKELGKTGRDPETAFREALILLRDDLPEDERRNAFAQMGATGKETDEALSADSIDTSSPLLPLASLLRLFPKEERDRLLDSALNVYREAGRKSEEHLSEAYSIIQERSQMERESLSESDKRLLNALKANAEYIKTAVRERGEKYPDIKFIPSSILPSYRDFKDSYIPGFDRSPLILENTRAAHETEEREISDDMLLMSLAIIRKEEGGDSSIYYETGIPDSLKAKWNNAMEAEKRLSSSLWKKATAEKPDIMEGEKRTAEALAPYSEDRLSADDLKRLRDTADKKETALTQSSAPYLGSTREQRLLSQLGIPDIFKDFSDDELRNTPLLSVKVKKIGGKFIRSNESDAIPLRDALSRESIDTSSLPRDSSPIRAIVSALMDADDAEELRTGIALASSLLQGIEGKEVRLPNIFPSIEATQSTKAFRRIISYEDAAMRGYSAFDKDIELTPEEENQLLENPEGAVWSRDGIEKAEYAKTGPAAEPDRLSGSNSGFKPQAFFKDMKKGYPVFYAQSAEDLREIADFMAQSQIQMPAMKRSDRELLEDMREYMDSERVLIVYPKNSIGGSATAGMRNIALSELIRHGFGDMEDSNSTVSLLSDTGRVRAMQNLNPDDSKSVLKAATGMSDRRLKELLITRELLRSCGARISYEDAESLKRDIEADEFQYSEQARRLAEKGKDIVISGNPERTMRDLSDRMREADLTGDRGIATESREDDSFVFYNGKRDSASQLPDTWASPDALRKIAAFATAKTAGTGKCWTEEMLFKTLLDSGYLSGTGIESDPELMKARRTASGLAMEIRSALSANSPEAINAYILQKASIKAPEGSQIARALLEERLRELDQAIRDSKSGTSEGHGRAKACFEMLGIPSATPTAYNFLNILREAEKAKGSGALPSELKEAERVALSMTAAMTDAGLRGYSFDKAYSLLFKMGLVADDGSVKALKEKKENLRAEYMRERSLSKEAADIMARLDTNEKGRTGWFAAAKTRIEKKRGPVESLSLCNTGGAMSLLRVQSDGLIENGYQRRIIRGSNPELMKSAMTKAAKEEHILGIAYWVPSMAYRDKEGNAVFQKPIPLFSEKEKREYLEMASHLFPDIPQDQLLSQTFSKEEKREMLLPAKEAQRLARAELGSDGWRLLSPMENPSGGEKEYRETGDAAFRLFSYSDLTETDTELAIREAVLRERQKSTEDASRDSAILEAYSTLDSAFDTKKPLSHYIEAFLEKLSKGNIGDKEAMEILRDSGLMDLADRENFKDSIKEIESGMGVSSYDSAKELISFNADESIRDMEKSLGRYMAAAFAAESASEEYAKDTAKMIGDAIEKATGKEPDKYRLQEAVEEAMYLQKLRYTKSRIRISADSVRGYSTLRLPDEKTAPTDPAMSYTASIVTLSSIQSEFRKAFEENIGDEDDARRILSDLIEGRPCSLDVSEKLKNTLRDLRETELHLEAYKGAGSNTAWTESIFNASLALTAYRDAVLGRGDMEKAKELMGNPESEIFSEGFIDSIKEEYIAAEYAVKEGLSLSEENFPCIAALSNRFLGGIEESSRNRMLLTALGADSHLGLSLWERDNKEEPKDHWTLMRLLGEEHRKKEDTGEIEKLSEKAAFLKEQIAELRLIQTASLDPILLQTLLLPENAGKKGREPKMTELQRKTAAAKTAKESLEKMQEPKPPKERIDMFLPNMPRHLFPEGVQGSISSVRILGDSSLLGSARACTLPRKDLDSIIAQFSSNGTEGLGPMVLTLSRKSLETLERALSRKGIAPLLKRISIGQNAIAAFEERYIIEVLEIARKLKILFTAIDFGEKAIERIYPRRPMEQCPAKAAESL